MKPLLVVQNNLVLKNSALIAEAARELEWDIYDCSLLPDLHPPVPQIDSDSLVMIYGSVVFPYHWKETKLKPWVFIDEQTFSVECWRSSLGEMLLNHDGHLIDFASLKETIREPLHIRPAHSLRKTVVGCVVDGDSILALDLAPDQRLWASAPKKIDAEIRVWFVHGEYVAASLYRLNDDHFRSADHPLVERGVCKARELAHMFLPHHHAVMDLGLHEGEWKVLEFNTIHSSGFYAVDPKTILRSYYNGYLP